MCRQNRVQLWDRLSGVSPKPVRKPGSGESTTRLPHLHTEDCAVVQKLA